MKTPGFDTLIFKSKRVEIGLALILIITITSVLLLNSADNLLSSESILLAIPLIALLVLISFQAPSVGREASGVTLVVALFILMVILPFLTRSYISPWIYLIPILLINFMNFRLNLFSISGYSLIVLFMISEAPNEENALPTLLSFILVCCLCLLMAFLKNQLLIRLKALDTLSPVTSWHVRQELKPSLQREIQRAEREGSGLSYSLIEFTAPELNENKWRLIKTFIENNTRPFDQIFHQSHRKIAIIHPYATTEEIKSRFTQANVPNPNVQFCAGIASLNIGDTEGDLISKARSALLCCNTEQQVICHEA